MTMHHLSRSKLALCAGLMLLLLPGCRTVRDLWPWTTAPGQVFRISESDEIRLTTGEIDEPYEEIAVIAVHEDGDAVLEVLSLRLREQARALGADAVIRVDYDLERAGGEAYLIQSATGTAVRIREP
jgi:hypothetical protein